MTDLCEWQARAWHHAEDKGFHTLENNPAARLMLVVCEVAEAVEALRHGNPPSEHCPEISSVAEELADVVIRVLDLAEELGIDLESAMATKMAFNAGRERLHGKKF